MPVQLLSGFGDGNGLSGGIRHASVPFWHCVVVQGSHCPGGQTFPDTGLHCWDCKRI